LSIGISRLICSTSLCLLSRCGSNRRDCCAGGRAGLVRGLQPSRRRAVLVGAATAVVCRPSRAPRILERWGRSSMWSCGVNRIAVLVALMQAIGVGTPWPYRAIWFGRVSGTTGNPLNLSGLCLLGVWLAVLAAAGALPRSRRIVAGVAALVAALGLILSVSRAADAGVVLAALFLRGCCASWTAGRGPRS